jgi:arylsulfatase
MLGMPRWKITAKVTRSSENDDGVLLATGTQNCGLSWYIKDNQLVFDYNLFSDHHIVRSDRTVPTGEFTAEVKLEQNGKKSSFSLFIDGQECGNISTPPMVRALSTTGTDIGRDLLSAVSPDYKVPFEFKGEIKQVNIELPMLKSQKEMKEQLETRERIENSRQ